jgi:ribose-phosphate pyrophosphokinase
MPLLFTLPEYSQTNKTLSDLPGLKPGHFSIMRYDNQESRVTIQSRVSHDHCFILGSVTPPECQMVSFLLLAHTLKKDGATRVTGILPYLAYSREDKLKPGQSLATAWTGAVLKASGLDEIWTVDLHSEQDRKLFPLPLESFFACAIFRESLGRLGLNGASFVSPDQGAIPPGNDVRRGDQIRKCGLLRKTSNRERNCAPHACGKRRAVRCDR